MRADSGRAQDGAFDGARKLDENEILRGIQVILPLVVNHANVIRPCRAVVGQNLINHARGQQVRVVRADADRKPRRLITTLRHRLRYYLPAAHAQEAPLADLNEERLISHLYLCIVLRYLLAFNADTSLFDQPSRLRH